MNYFPGQKSPELKKEERQAITKLIIWLSAITLLLIVVFAAGCPQYNVYKKEKSGEAQLKEAEQNRQVRVEEAKAELESASLDAQSEIERAKGAAQAIKIEDGKLTDRYIQYLWVRSNKFDQATTIYVPTETNLPILEAGRLP